MIVTNETRLPLPFVQMATRDNYSPVPGVYRVTSLLKGIRETLLERRHHNDIIVDAADMVWMLFGTATHNILEKSEVGSAEIKEERLTVKVGDYTLAGTFDLYNEEEQKIVDYKTTSVWKVIYQNYDDWKKQLLIYGFLLRSYGFDVNKGEVIALLKDHSKTESRRKADYPKHPVKKVTFKFTEQDFADTEQWITDKFAEIAKAEQLPDEELPLCSPEERYNSGDKYAVMNGKNKRAVRVYDSREEAEEWMRKGGKGDRIDVRPGIDRKCTDYCRVASFCSHVKKSEENERSV